MKGYKVVSIERLGIKNELLNFSDENRIFHTNEGTILAKYIFCKHNPYETEYYQV